MIKTHITVFIFLFTTASYGQALRDINYRYLYNPEENFTFDLKPAKQNGNWIIAYELQLRDTTNESIDDYSIEWQGREAISSKDGTPLELNKQDSSQRAMGFFGSFEIPDSKAPNILVAKVVNNGLRRAYFFYTHLESNYPVNNHLRANSKTLTTNFISVKQTANFTNTDNQWTVSYYNDDFPPAAPAFSVGQGKVPKAMKADSIFAINGGDAIEFFARGLFLFQQDTLSADGIAVRAESDYPRYTLVQNLPGPLIYICTKAEYDKLEVAKGDKKAFDRTVLNVTGNAERAKKLIRNYFRRVELANQYFTSFKEGWKTDRGMIYIVFGLPDEVFRLNDREVWSYQNDTFDITFDFIRSGTIFAPDNYVLIRENKFKSTWYEVIELWRNARF